MNEPFDPGETTSGTPIILIATDPAALKRAENGFSAAFIDPTSSHLLEDIGMDELAGHAVWLEIGEDKGPRLDRWLMAFDAYAGQSAKPINVAMTAPMVDVVTAYLDGHFAFLVAPDTMERAGAIGDLFMRSVMPASLYNARGMNDEKQLRQLSDEVARIAATLSRLSAADGGYHAQAPSSEAIKPARSGADPATVSVDTVREAIRARRMREKYFAADYFADPAWDMLLDLLAAEMSDHRVPVSSLCIAAAVPATTALRWMKTLTEAGIFLRKSDPRDGRRVFVELSDDASLALRRYFAEVEGKLVA